MAIGYDIKLDGVSQAINRFAKLDGRMKSEVGDAVEQIGNKVSASAVGRVNRHPSGLWKKAGAARYPVKRDGQLNVTVQTPGGAVGKAEAISEFASTFKSPQGRNLISVLNSTYGRPGGSGGGRILYAAYDELAPSIESDIVRKVEEVANG